jgi:hypothetical protein
MCSRVHCLLLTAALLWLGAAPLISFGQSAESASIVGKVSDDKGNAIPGVAIDVTSPALQVPSVSTISDQDGNYKVLDLPAPGVYRVAFSLTGFQTFVRDGLNLPVGFAGRVDAVMTIGQVTQTVEVTGGNPVVDTVNTSTQTTIPLDQLVNIPRGANLQEMEPMVTGLNLAGKPDVGDSNMASRATTFTYGIPLETTLGVEGIDNTDDHFANSSIYINFYAVQEANFKTSGNNADIAYPGVDQIVVMKSGSNNFHGSARGNYENPSFQSNNLSKELAGPPSNLKFTNPLADPGYYDYAFDLGGRIIRNKLWFYGGYSKQSLNEGQVGYVAAPGKGCSAVTAWIASQCPGAQLAEIFSHLPEYNAKVNYQMTPSVNLVGSWMYNVKSIPNEQGTPFVPLPASLFEKLPSWTWKGEAQVVRPHWLLDILGGVGDAHPAYIPQPASELAKYGYTKGTGFAGAPAQEDLFNALYTGTNPEVYYHVYDRHQLGGTYSYLPPNPILGGTHQFKFGTNWTFEEGDTQVLKEYPSGDYLLLFSSPNAETNTANPAQITVYNYPVDPKNRLHTQAFYATDTWSLKHVVLNLGLRGERFHSFYPNQTTKPGQFASVFPSQTYPGQTVLSWTDVVPRAGAAWDVRGNGKTVVKASFGMFGDTPGFLYANLYNPESVQSMTYTWNGPCIPTDPVAPEEFSCDVTPAFLATLPSLTPVSRTGGSSQLVNLNLKQDQTFEYVGRVERQLVPNVSLSAGFIRHSIYSLFDAATNSGSEAATTSYTNNGILVGHAYSSYTLPATGYTYKLNGTSYPVTVYTYPVGSGSTHNQFLNTPSSRPDVYNSLEISVTKNYSKKWNGSTSFWLTKNHRWINGLAGTGVGSPNDDAFPIDNTWNWEARANVYYNLPWGFNASSFFRATSGTYGQLTGSFGPNPVSVANGGNNQRLSQGSVTMRLGPFGQYQGPFIEVLNLKIAKVFKVKEKYSFESNFQVFNSFNSSAAVSTSYLASTFGAVTNIVSARVFRIGGVFNF